MKKDNELSLQEINKFLSDVQNEKSLWINNGPVVHNLYEFVGAIRSINDDTFRYHVNETKDDFGLWIKEVITDSNLAEEISKIKDKEKFARAIEKRISSLERLASKRQEQLLKEANNGQNNIHQSEKPIQKIIHEEIKKDIRTYIWIFILGLIVGVILGMFLETFFNF